MAESPARYTGENPLRAAFANGVIAEERASDADGYLGCEWSAAGGQLGWNREKQGLSSRDERPCC